MCVVTAPSTMPNIISYTNLDNFIIMFFYLTFLKFHSEAWLCHSFRVHVTENKIVICVLKSKTNKSKLMHHDDLNKSLTTRPIKTVISDFANSKVSSSSAYTKTFRVMDNHL